LKVVCKDLPGGGGAHLALRQRVPLAILGSGDIRHHKMRVQLRIQRPARVVREPGGAQIAGNALAPWKSLAQSNYPGRPIQESLQLLLKKMDEIQTSVKNNSGKSLSQAIHSARVSVYVQIKTPTSPQSQPKGSINLGGIASIIIPEFPNKAALVGLQLRVTAGILLMTHSKLTNLKLSAVRIIYSLKNQHQNWQPC
jgi:hypothetical protein